jgi:hypothetical protein
MAIVGRLGTESVKGLGPGAYLVSVLPSAVLVVTVYLLFAARLYPWTAPPKGTSRGFDSIVDTLASLSAAEIAALVAVVLMTSVLLRPLHVAAVQLLEGYWGARTAIGALEWLAIERQLRRYARARARRSWVPPTGEHGAAEFATVVELARRLHRIERRKVRARQIANSYPGNEAAVLPTLLGNLLRRAETTAGERFGLDTVASYPRLYPFLGERLHDGLATQFNLLDSAAAFTIVFWALGVFSIPTAWLGSGWFLIPSVFLLAGGLAYAGAMATAREHGTLLAAAYDLHRFDMLAGLRLPLPRTPDQERSMNEQLTDFLRFADAFAVAPDPAQRFSVALSYQHPDPSANQAVTSGPDDRDVGGGGGEPSDTASGDSSEESPGDEETAPPTEAG